jgi:hypothetical protein
MMLRSQNAFLSFLTWDNVTEALAQRTKWEAHGNAEKGFNDRGFPRIHSRTPRLTPHAADRAAGYVACITVPTASVSTDASLSADVAMKHEIPHIYYGILCIFGVAA